MSTWGSGFGNSNKNSSYDYNNAMYNVWRAKQYPSSSSSSRSGSGSSSRRSSSGSGSGSSSGSSYSSTGSGSSGFDWNAYYNNLSSQLAAERQARQQAAQSAYERNKSILNGAYDQNANALRENFNSTANQLQGAYNNSKAGLNSDAESSLRDAYVNNMMNKKNLDQDLSAKGLTGGAAESTLAGLYNEYGNSRNSINTTLNKNLSNLEQTYNSNLASAQQEYNKAMADNEMNRASQMASLESALANEDSSELSDSFGVQTSGTFLNALANALAQQQSYQGDPTAATNTINTVSAQQGSAGDNSATNYARMQAIARNMADSSASNDLLNASGVNTLAQAYSGSGRVASIASRISDLLNNGFNKNYVSLALKNSGIKSSEISAAYSLLGV